MKRREELHAQDGRQSPRKHMICAIGVDHRYDICGEIRSM